METRERILKAAGRLFGEIGFSRTTTRAIASEAGVNEVTLFRHFGSKQNLLQAFVDQFNAEGFAATFEQHLSGDYRTDIHRMARLQMEHTLANFRLLRLMVCDAPDAPDMIEIAVRGAQGNYARLAGYFQRQIDAGVVRPGITAEMLVYGFEGLFSTIIFFQAAFGADLTPQPEANIDQICDLFVEGTIQKDKGKRKKKKS